MPVTPPAATVYPTSPPPAPPPAPPTASAERPKPPTPEAIRAQQAAEAEVAERESRRRAEMQAMQQTIEQVRAQLTEAASAMQRETQARTAVEAELHATRTELANHRADLAAHRSELEARQSEIAALRDRGAELDRSLTASKQEAELWGNEVRRTQVEIERVTAAADRAAADAAQQLDEMTRRRSTAEERVARLVEQSAAHEAANAQLRATIGDQRADRERITAERDEARQRTAELEARLQAGAFVTDQVAGDAALAAEEAAHRLELSEERANRFEDRSAAYERLAEELRETITDQRDKLERLTEERDAARRRADALAAEVDEVSRTHREAVVEEMRWLDEPVIDEPAFDLPKPSPVPVVEDGFLPPEDDATTDLEVSVDHPVSVATEIELDPWQREALTNWANAGHRGVIEAIAGAGSELLVHWSIGQALDTGMKVLVVAPSTEQVDQWFAVLRDALPINRIGRYDGGKDPRLASYDVVVSTAHNAAKELGPPADGLLVAVDVHAFGTAPMAKALDEAYSWRLGLTTVYARDDGGIATYLDPYFGSVCFRLGFDRALDEGAIAAFDVALVALRLADVEQAEYDALSVQLKEQPEGKASAKAAAKQAEILANTSARNHVLRALASQIRDTEPALVFAATEQAIGHATRVFEGQGCAATRLDAGDRARRAGHAPDDDGEFCLLAGRNRAEAIPAIELAIFLGDSRSRRQLIQRVGQVVSDRGGRRAHLVVLYIEGTPEDDLGNAEPPLTTELIRHATKVERFTASDTEGLLEFIATGRISAKV